LDKNGNEIGSTDYTIIPVEMNWTIHIGFKDGFKSMFGSLPEISYRTLNKPDN
jgi:hypothetical protein